MSQVVEFRSWEADKLISHIGENIQRNAEQTGDFIYTQAKKNLDAIQTPADARSKNYRYYLSKYILTHFVEREKDLISIYVGMRIGKNGQRHHGYYIETGSHTAPAKPYLRNALFNNLRDVVAMLTGDA
jgi:hypothetical protein